jgi:hypothetical protein
MEVKNHAIIGLITSLFLFPFVGFLGVITIFIVNIAIDSDHIYRYWMKGGFTLNPIKVITKWGEVMERTKNGFDSLYFSLNILHTLEVVALFWIVSLTIAMPLLIWVSIGLTIHIMTDYLEPIINKGRLPSPSEGGRSISLFYWLYSILLREPKEIENAIEVY